jgi:acyl carrier protein
MEKSVVNSKVKKIISNLFKINIIEISDQTSPSDSESWDSLNHIKLILQIEKEFNIKIDDSEINTLINVKIIVNTILSHL